MDKIYVVYWSQTGNTQAMAEAIGKGITEAGKEANVVYVGSASLDELKAANAFALGCPSMGVEVLDEAEMEPFVPRAPPGSCAGSWRRLACSPPGRARAP